GEVVAQRLGKTHGRHGRTLGGLPDPGAVRVDGDRRVRCGTDGGDVQVVEGKSRGVPESGVGVGESGAARSTQELASRPGVEVAADAPHVDVDLADRLTTVDEVQCAVSAQELADLLDRIDDPAAGGHVRHRHQCAPFGQVRGEPFEVQ